VSGSNPILGSYGSTAGTGGGNAVQDANGNWYLSYHAWDSSCATATNSACKRKFYVANLVFG
jgi:hypothetical protein